MSLPANFSNTVVKDSTFIDNSTSTTINNYITEGTLGPDRLGLKELLDKSIPGATHDSSDRYPPPLCHPGTREELIEQLVTWGRNGDQVESIAWVEGPAGAGKSALCQSSADRLGDDLAASFFFSRPNRRSDPKRFFPTIAYQLAVKCTPYGDLLDQKIRGDSTIITKSLPQQFHELITSPIREVLTSGKKFAGKVIIVDGLDECEGVVYQREILDIIARSVTDKTTPFLWIIASRPERQIASQFERPDLSTLTVQKEVTISPDLDPEIFLFLANRLAETRKKYGLDESWPREEDLSTLVKLSSGMFAYSEVIALFIDDENSTSPVKQLGLVLDLAKRANAERGSRNPLEQLDFFYATLILERLPSEKCDHLRSILLVRELLSDLIDRFEDSKRSTGRIPFTRFQRYANVLGYSHQEFESLAKSFRAVVKDGRDDFKFYHASFMDFLLDPSRSGQFCIRSMDCVKKLLDKTQEALDDCQLDSARNPKPSLSWNDLVCHRRCPEQYHSLVVLFLKTLGMTMLAGDVDEEKSAALKKWDFRKLVLLGEFGFEWKQYGSVDLYDCLKKQGGNLVRSDWVAFCGKDVLDILRIKVKNTANAFSITPSDSCDILILGRGKKSVQLQFPDGGDLFVSIRPRSLRGLEKYKRAQYKKYFANVMSTVDT